MSYRVKLEVFEGPFDLLFHLIKKAEIDIYQVSIREITLQYIGYIKDMQQLDMRITGDFLVMASVLLKLKSQKILPSYPEELEEEHEEGEELVYASEEEFKERLLEYKLFKRAAAGLKLLEEEEDKYFPHRVNYRDNQAGEVDLESFLKGLSLEKLKDTLERLLREKEGEEDPPVIYPRGLSLKEKMEELVNFLIQDPGPERLEIFFRRQRGKEELIISFLALLALVKKRQVMARQQVPLGPIRYTGNGVTGQGQGHGQAGT